MVQIALESSPLGMPFNNVPSVNEFKTFMSKLTISASLNTGSVIFKSFKISPSLNESKKVYPSNLIPPEQSNMFDNLN